MKRGGPSHYPALDTTKNRGQDALVPGAEGGAGYAVAVV